MNSAHRGAHFLQETWLRGGVCLLGEPEAETFARGKDNLLQRFLKLNCIYTASETDGGPPLTRGSN